MKDKKEKQPRAQRKTVVPFEQHSGDPPAIVEGRFMGVPNSIVHAWRFRTGCKPKWHRCTVIRVAEAYVELWDEDLGQWLCFDPREKTVPDTRLSP